MKRKTKAKVVEEQPGEDKEEKRQKALLNSLLELGVQSSKQWEPMKRISSGSLRIDRALNGGWARGTYNTITGPEGSGKTLLCTLTAIAARRQGLSVAYIDSECKLNRAYAKQSGLDEFFYQQPKTAEDAFEAITKLVELRTDLIILDSLQMSPNAEIDGDLGDNTPAVFARISNKFFRRAVAKVADSGSCILITNQLRTGEFGSRSGAKDVRPGGRGKDFAPNIAIDLDKQFFIDINKDGKVSNSYPKYAPRDLEISSAGEILGMKINGMLYKNSTGPNFTNFSASVRYYPRLHTLYHSELVDLAEEFMCFTKEDGTQITLDHNTKFYYKDENIAKGRLEAIKWLMENPEEAEAIEQQVRASITNREGRYADNPH